MLTKVVLPAPLAPMMPTVSRGRDLDRDVVGRDDGAEALLQTAGRDHRLAHRGPSSALGA